MAEWLAGLGAGLQSLGSSGMQLMLQEQERRRRGEELAAAEKRRQEELTRAQDELKRAQQEQARQQQQAFGLKAFELGLTPYDEAVAPIQRANKMARETASGMGIMGSGLEAMQDVPALGGGIMGMTGRGLKGASDALAQLAQKSQERLQKGRTLDYTDATGKVTKYYQPYERTEQGQKDAEMTRGMQALAGAGFSEAESRAIMASPEKLQTALIERLRPKPKEAPAPREVVRPDGSVVYVQPPPIEPGQSWDSGIQQRVPAAPGSAPYNWSVQTDDTTGNVVLVDPRTGQSKPVTAPGGQEPLRNLPEAVQKKAYAMANLRANLEQLKGLVEEHGLALQPGQTRSAMQSALANAQVAWKEAAALGALSGPDMGMVLNAIGDPTSFSAVPDGASGVLSKLLNALQTLDKEEQIFTSQYGVPIPGRGGPTQDPRAGLSAAERDIYDAAKREGKSDAEIMAFLRQMRGTWRLSGEDQ